MQTKYLVVGVNAAGFYAIEALRKNDPLGSITAINGEVYSPYKRTKINKHFYPDNLNIDKFQLVDSSWYLENKITLLNNTRVISIDISKKTANLDDGKKLKWEKLLFTTGAESFCPPSDIFKKAVSIRFFNDAFKVKKLIETKESSLVYGLGIEAVETAAQLHESGLKVSIAGRGGKLLKRYFSSHIAGIIENLFKSRGIDILHNIDVNQISSLSSKNLVDGERSIFLALDDGKNRPYDFLLYSTGIKPRKELAEACNINTERGIVVNSKMETSVSDIYAAGDCAQLDSGSITDHWHSAQDQGRTAAANMAGIFSTWPVKKYRLKVELFGEFFFSMRPFVENIPENMEVEESILSTGAYRLFYFEKGLLKGLEMAGDKPRAKLYEAAVNEEWQREKILDLLG